MYAFIVLNRDLCTYQLCEDSPPFMPLVHEWVVSTLLASVGIFAYQHPYR